jgi:hypothetical protein
MTTEFLVIAGCLGIERCWKRLFGGQWYFLKSRFVKPVEVLFKGNSRSFDLKHSALWCVIDHPGPSAFFERQNWWVQAEPVSENLGFFSYCRDFPRVHLPALSSLAFSK